MSKYFYSFVFFLTTTIIYGQVFQIISTGQGYKSQSYVNLGKGTEKLVNNDSWDLAFTAAGFQDAGIFINESSGSSMGTALPSIELFEALVDKFDEIPDEVKFKEYRLYNSEKDWSFGAFNEVRDSTDVFDYGWGQYNPASNKVLGNKVYVVKLRDNNYKKLIIESLDRTTYNIKYANLDGTGLKTIAVDKKKDSFGKGFIFFSFQNDKAVDILPAEGFDFLYTRYTAVATDPNGTLVQQYNVTGVITAPGVKVAEADGVNPITVSAQDYADKYNSRADVIGFDWKSLVGTTAWKIDEDKVFFVNTNDKRLWKIHFVDFEGSISGKATFEKTDLGISSSYDILDNVVINIYPNPVMDKIFISQESTGKGIDNIKLHDILGHEMKSINLSKNDRFQVTEINVTDLKSGQYILNISNSEGKSVNRVFIKN